MAIDLDAVEKATEFFPSDKFIISCGTVTIDLVAGKVLLIYNHKLKIYQFPKGRKNIGEDWLSTALRETHEESGVKPSALSLMVDTRATPAKGPASQVQITSDIFNTEAVSMYMYPDPVSGCLKIVFWFAAIGDSMAPIQRNEDGQEDWEDFTTVWKPIGESLHLLRFRDDRRTVRRVVELATRSGLTLPDVEGLDMSILENGITV